jgi:hypothetical protein
VLDSPTLSKAQHADEQSTICTANTRLQSQKQASDCTPVSEMHLGAAEKRWVANFRKAYHVCGVGEGSKQVRARHVALMNECVPDWDAKWQSKLATIKKLFKEAGVL